MSSSLHLQYFFFPCCIWYRPDWSWEKEKGLYYVLSFEIYETSAVDSEAGSIMRLGTLSDGGFGLSALFE